MSGIDCSDFYHNYVGYIDLESRYYCKKNRCFRVIIGVAVGVAVQVAIQIATEVSHPRNFRQFASYFAIYYVQFS
jgi:hypothetical protein